MSEDEFSHGGTEETESTEKLNVLSRAIIGEAMQIHRDLDPGLLENIYEQILAASLTRRGLRVV